MWLHVFFLANNRRQNKISSDRDQWDTQLASTLKLALVMQSTVDAVFIDCAVYAIIVIFNISLCRHDKECFS